MAGKDDVLAVPLWIGGHAYLTMAPQFHDVVNPLSGKLLRRTPLCTAYEVDLAIKAARGAIADWASAPGSLRSEKISGLAEMLSSYASHFAALIADETGKDGAAAEAEVVASAALLGRSEAIGRAHVTCIPVGSKQPLSDALVLAAPVLRAGGCVVVRPDPNTPSSLVALAELTARCGFPAGVFNLVHGDEAVCAAMRAMSSDEVVVIDKV